MPNRRTKVPKSGIRANKGIIVADGSLKDILAQHNKKNLEEIFYDLAGEEGEKA